MFELFGLIWSKMLFIVSEIKLHLSLLASSNRFVLNGSIARPVFIHHFSMEFISASCNRSHVVNFFLPSLTSH